MIPAPAAQTLVAFLLYFGLACSVTWPIAIHPGSRVFGPIGADLTGGMAYFHALAAAHTPPFLPGTVHGFNAPEGRSTQWALNFSTLPSSTLLWLGSMAFGAVAAFGYWAIFAFTLSALSMFLLVRWLTGSWQAALVTGFAFGFWPYVFSSMNQPLGDEWVIVLAVWRILVSIERPTARNGLLAGAAVALAIMWVQYFILIFGVTWATLAVLALVIARTRGQLAAAVRTQALAAVPVLLVVAAIGLAGLASDFAGAPVRAASDLVTYSARPLMYLLPDPNNPFFGSLTKPIIDRDFYSPTSTSTYNEIYLGISVMALALAGVVVLVLTIRRRGWRLALTDRSILAALLLMITAVIAVAFSAPPHVIVLGVNLPMPMALVGDVTTVFRTTARFAVIVMLGLCVLAGLALSRLFSRLRPPVALILAAVLSLVVVGDLWARAPYNATVITVPSVVRLLSHQPPGIYAEYPLLLGADFGGDSTDAFYQGYAGKHDLFDGYFAGTPSESRKMELDYPLAPRTIPDLAALGVRYLLIDHIDGTLPPQYPAFEAPVPGARLIGGDAFAALYRIVAPPAPLASFYTVGFALPVGSGTLFYRWMMTTDASMEIASLAAKPLPVRVSFTAASYATPRRLVIRDGARVVYDAVVPETTAVPVTFTAIVRGDTTLDLHVSPAPESPNQLNAADPDTEPLALQLSGPAVLMPVRPTRSPAIGSRP